MYLSTTTYLSQALFLAETRNQKKSKMDIPNRNCFSDSALLQAPCAERIEDDNFSVGSDSVFGSEAQAENGSVLDFSYHGSLQSAEFCSSINTNDLSGLSFHSIAEDGRVEQKEVEIKEDLTKAATVSVTDQQYSPKKITEPDIEDKYKGKFKVQILHKLITHVRR